MKNLKVPLMDTDIIYAAEIGTNFPGIIVAFKDQKAVGIIVYKENKGWCFQTTIDDRSIVESGPTILNLIYILVKDKKMCDNFKVLDFYYENC